MNALVRPDDARTLAERRRLLVSVATMQRLRLRLELHDCHEALQPLPLVAQGLASWRSPTWSAVAVWSLRALALWRLVRALRALVRGA